jgi:CBS domain-containing protein
MADPRAPAHAKDEVCTAMTSPAVVVGPDTPLRAAAQLLRHHDIGAVAVVTVDGLVGVLSERDLVGAIADGLALGPARVGDAMTGTPRPVAPDSPLWAAAMLMLRDGVRHLPVTDGHRVVGMLSIRDALAVFERDRLVEPRTTVEAVA